MTGRDEYERWLRCPLLTREERDELAGISDDEIASRFFAPLSFGTAGLLEYPQYTRPQVFEGEAVPEVLVSGDHKKIAQWRREQSLLATARLRPELLRTAELSERDCAFLRSQGYEDAISF